MNPAPRVAIIGAGIAGLSCATPGMMRTRRPALVSGETNPAGSAGQGVIA